MHKRLRGILLMLGGVICLGAMLTLTLQHRSEAMEAGDAAAAVLPQLTEHQETQHQLVQPTPDIPDLPVKTEMTTVLIDGEEYLGTISIPALGIELPVMAQLDDAKLKISPCLYKGSYLEDSMIIAGHNYQRHFGGLHQLYYGDSVRFTDVDGYTYDYQVAFIETLTGNDVEGMMAGEWDLTLFTCTYGGANRVTVRLQRV